MYVLYVIPMYLIQWKVKCIQREHQHTICLFSRAKKIKVERKICTACIPLLSPCFSFALNARQIATCHTFTHPYICVGIKSFPFRHHHHSVQCLYFAFHIEYVLEETKRKLYFNDTSRSQCFIIYKFMRWCYLNDVVIATHTRSRECKPVNSVCQVFV